MSFSKVFLGEFLTVSLWKQKRNLKRPNLERNLDEKNLEASQMRTMKYTIHTVWILDLNPSH